MSHRNILRVSRGLFLPLACLAVGLLLLFKALSAAQGEIVSSSGGSAYTFPIIAAGLIVAGAFGAIWSSLRAKAPETERSSAFGLLMLAPVAALAYLLLLLNLGLFTSTVTALLIGFWFTGALGRLSRVVVSVALAGFALWFFGMVIDVFLPGARFF